MYYAKCNSLQREKENVENYADEVDKLQLEINKIDSQLDKMNTKKFKFEKRLGKAGELDGKNQLLANKINLQNRLEKVTERRDNSIKYLVRRMGYVAVQSNSDCYIMLDCARTLSRFAASSADKGVILNALLTAQSQTSEYYNKLDEFLAEDPEYLKGYLHQEKNTLDKFESIGHTSIVPLFVFSMGLTNDINVNGGYVYSTILRDAGYRDMFFTLEGENMKEILSQPMLEEDRMFWKQQYNRFRIDNHQKSKLGSHILNGGSKVAHGIETGINKIFEFTAKLIALPFKGISAMFKKLSFVCDYKSTYATDRKRFMSTIKKVLKENGLGGRGLKGISAKLIEKDGKHLVNIQIDKITNHQEDKIDFFFPVNEGQYYVMEDVLSTREEFEFDKKEFSAKDYKLMRNLAQTVSGKQPEQTYLVNDEEYEIKLPKEEETVTFDDELDEKVVYQAREEENWYMGE